MRYALQRYDDIYGDTSATMVCDDAYFNREELNFIGNDLNSLEACVNAVISFLGTDDCFNINDLHYIPLTGSPYDDNLSEIIAIFTGDPYAGAVEDGSYHRVTGIIKFENKTTTCTDWSYKYNGTSGSTEYWSGNYRGAWSSSPTGYTSAPWVYEYVTNITEYNLLRGAVSVSFYYFALPSDVVGSDGVINISDDTQIARIHVTIESYNIDRLSLLSESFQCSVQIDYFNISDSVRAVLNDEETSPQEDPNKDPYAGNPSNGGASGTGGGHFTPVPPATGTYNPGSDPNPVPGLPTISAADTGFITLFNPTSTQLKNLAQYMWGSMFDPSTWKKLFADPMDCILGLSIVPVDVPISSVEAVKVGNISTGISMNKASSQFVEVNCGTISIGEKWKAYLDYAPYTKLSIYLPFIGAQDLNIDDIQINTIGVVYHIDVLSGACVAFITAGGNVIAQYSGQCAISIPVTSKDFTQTIIALGTLVAGGVAAAATGGMSAPVSASSIGGAATAMATTAANVITSKPTIQKSGNMSGSNGLMGVQTPYLFITRPKQCAPKNQNRYVGYPSYITEKLANLSGFTQIQDIRLTGISCTESEMNEILNLLHEGVIL